MEKFLKVLVLRLDAVYWIKHWVHKDSTYATTKLVDTQLGSRILTWYRSHSLASSLKSISNKAKNSTGLLVPGKTKRSRRRYGRGLVNTWKKPKLKSEGLNRLRKGIKCGINDSFISYATSPSYIAWMNAKTEAENHIFFSSMFKL